jgi:hypothetical protein
MVLEPSHVKQLSPIHVCKIGSYNLLMARGGGEGAGDGVGASHNTARKPAPGPL